MNFATIPHTIAPVEGHRAIWLAGPTCVAFNAIGEQYRAADMHAVAAQLHGRFDVAVPGWLTLSPDGRSVCITVFGRLVGFLATDIEASWLTLIRQFEAHYGAKVACNVTLDPPSHENAGGYGVRVWLPPVVATVDRKADQLSATASKLAQEVDRLREERAAEESKRKATLAETKAEAKQTVQEATAELAAIRAAAAQTKLEALKVANEEAERIRKEALAEAERIRIAAHEDLIELKSQIQAAQMDLDALDDTRDVKSFGFYAPKYDFESSSQYAFKLAEIREQQKKAMSDDRAYVAGSKLTVGGSAAEGKKLVKQLGKLMLRAFNGECDAAISRVKYNNVDTVEEKVKKSFEAINKLGELQTIAITRDFLNLRLAELYLVHEHREKEQEEREEQKRVKEQMREEMKAQEEIERAKAEAEKEEEKKAAALEKARQEMAIVEAAGKNNEKLAELVAKLETELSSAIDRKAKAIARAQLTKSGHVYVLSNIGSFGEGVYKIGMTRRLEPLERVEELGDASVPFPFDVHAIIYCEDAPGLENKLHKAFAAKRVNLVNGRKEYFRVTLDEIRDVVEKEHGLVSFLLAAHAEEYRKSEASRRQPVDGQLAEASVSA